MHVLFVAARERAYARNDVIVRALRRIARVDVLAPAQSPRSLLIASAQMSAAAARRLATQRYDLVVVGFYGSLLVPALRPLTSGPLLFDAFVSNYDTLAFDRAAFTPGSARGRLALLLDRIPCALADAVLLDTQQHVDYFANTLGVDAERMVALPVGCNEDIFFPTPLRAVDTATAPVAVLYYCTYLPLHGVETVLYAAAYLAGQNIAFRLIGDGPQRCAMEDLARALRLEHVTFLPTLPSAQIAGELARAQIALGGHFGPSAKAQRTIPGKIYQMLAAARPLIAADTPANRALLVHERSALLTPPQDPAALALAILALARDPDQRARLAAGGHSAYLANASEAVITQRLTAIVNRLVGGAS